MGIFSSKKYYLGIDIGNSAIKVVEMMPRGRRAKLSTYGYVEINTDMGRPAKDAEEDIKISLAIRKVLEKSGAVSRKVVSSLHNFSVFSSIIALPKMSKKDLGRAVMWEAKKFIPFNIEEMKLYWKILPEEDSPASIQIEKGDAQKDKHTNILGKVKGDDGVSFQKVLITAAPLDIVNRYVNIFKLAKLELIALETESFALERALIGKDKSVIMIIDFGAFTTDVGIVENGIPILNRSIDVGGDTVTKAIAKSLNIDIKRAEQFKRDIGFTSDGIPSVPKVIETTISPIINEIKYSFDLFQSRSKDGVIEKIILTGGSSTLPGLTDYLSRVLQINVYLGDPWARVIYPNELHPVLEEIGPRFSVAVGLGMREIV